MSSACSSVQPSGTAALHQRHAANVVDARPGSPCGDAMRDLDHRALGVAVEQEVGLGVDQDRAAHLVRPVVVMRDAAQRRLDAAEHDRHVRIGLAAALRVDDDGAVRPFAALAARRVAVVVAQAAVGGVAVDHRIHVAAGDAEEQVRLAQRLERLGALPVGLGDDADAKALRLQQAADDRHAEARMVDIGVAGDEDDVAAVPAERVHLGPRHRQERRDAEPLRPVFAVGEQRLRGRLRRRADNSGRSARGGGSSR